MSKEIISVKDVRHVAKLARIAMSEEELAKYQSQLERILAHVAQLESIPTEGVPAASHPYESAAVWREDVARPFGDLEALFKNAPEMEETFFRVKKVIE